MKRFPLLFIVIFLSGFGILNAQDTPGEKAKSAVKEQSKDRMIVELTFNNWFHKLDSVSTEWYSRGINLYGMYDYKFGKSPVSIGIGAGVGSNHIFYNAAVPFNDTSLGMSVLAPINMDKVKKNKIATTFIDIPLELRFRTNPSPKGNSFKVALGFKGGLLVDSHTKQKVEEGDATRIYKVKRLDNMAKFRYGPTFRIGYGPVNLVAFYSLSGFFQDGKGPEITPFSIGISVNGL